MLIGRERERERIDRLLAEARQGRSGALIIRGEPGSGKTVLLEQAIGAVDGARVVQARGVATESDFAYAGLHELVRPLLGALDELPPVQGDALRGALALDEPRNAGRLFIGAATLTLLAAAAGGGTLVCVVDDADLLDGASLDALLFAARRLEREGVAMLFASTADLGPAAIETLELDGLAEAAVGVLLGEHATAAVATEVAAATGGNPRAVLDVARRLTPEQLAGAEPLPHPVPVGPDVEEAFARPVRALSEDARRALVLAATADTRALRVITRADSATRAAFEECEGAGLLTVADGQVEFNHPLFRASVYQQASPVERRDAHRALADAFTDEERYAERRAWHAAAAAVEPDESVASALEESADAARLRRGHVAAATMYERAARLTPDTEPRARRVYRAAESAWLAGRPERARRLLDDASPRDALVRADVAYLRARMGIASDLRTEAARVEAVDPVRAALLLAAASESAQPKERLRLAERAADLAAGRGDAAEVYATLALARAATRPDDAVAALERATHLLTPAFRADPELLLAAVDTLAAVDPADTALARELLDAARTQAVVVVPRALVHLGWLEFAGGHWKSASAHFAEAARLGTETGQPRESVSARAGLALLDALTGGAPDTDGLPAGTASRVLGLAELGRGRGEAAAVHLADAGSELLPRGLPPVSVDLAAALVRSGRAVDADDAWTAGLLGDVASFAKAAADYADTPFLAARCRLDLGEMLRRNGERAQARAELDAALATFEALGAQPWAERARDELRATGATPRRREASAFDELTPRELQVARAVAAEASYKDAAAKLYLSPKTVEYHLSKVYRKLGITSGRQLAQRLAEEGLADEP